MICIIECLYELHQSYNRVTSDIIHDMTYNLSTFFVCKWTTY